MDREELVRLGAEAMNENLRERGVLGWRPFAELDPTLQEHYRQHARAVIDVVLPAYDAMRDAEPVRPAYDASEITVLGAGDYPAILTHEQREAFRVEHPDEWERVVWLYVVGEGGDPVLRRVHSDEPPLFRRRVGKEGGS